MRRRVGCDVLILGGGVAGAAAAARIQSQLHGVKVIVLETESQPGYHSTGRSAAIFTET